MIVRRPILLGALLLAAALPVVAGTASGDAVVIELGDRELTRAQVDERFSVAVHLLARRQGVELAEQDPALIEQLRQQYLDKYATELILLEEARRRGLDVPGADVDTALADLFASDAEKHAFLDDVGMPGAAGDTLLRRLVRDEKLVEVVTEHLLQEIRIPAGDVITMHHDTKHLLTTPEEVCVRHIQLTSAANANDVLAKLKEGADFAALARERSRDEATAAAGGDLGCFARSSAASRSAFEKAAFAAREGEITGPVESQLGHHVLVVYDRRASRQPTLNEAYAEVERELALEKLPESIKTLVDNSGINIYADRFAVAPE